MHGRGLDRVGLIGLGKMGQPIAGNLMGRGFPVTGYRRSGSPELPPRAAPWPARPPTSPRSPTCCSRSSRPTRTWRR